MSRRCKRIDLLRTRLVLMHETNRATLQKKQLESQQTKAILLTSQMMETYCIAAIHPNDVEQHCLHCCRCCYCYCRIHCYCFRCRFSHLNCRHFFCLNYLLSCCCSERLNALTNT